MADFEDCANNAIGVYVHDHQPHRWPNWGEVVPGGGANGWGVNKQTWRDQARQIYVSFNQCVGLAIDYPVSQIDERRNQSLNKFLNYLVEKAKERSAILAVEKSKAALAAVKAQITTYKVRT